MSNEVINVGGEQKIVREDTAKSYRGVIWAFGSIAMFIVIAAIILFFVFVKNVANGTTPNSPANIEQNR